MDVITWSERERRRKILSLNMRKIEENREADRE